MRINLVSDIGTSEPITSDNGMRVLYEKGLKTRTIVLDVDDAGAAYIHAMINSLDSVKRGCATGQMCVWDNETGLHVDGTPCLYIHGTTPIEKEPGQ